MSKLKENESGSSGGKTLIGIIAIIAIILLIWSSYKNTYCQNNISVDNKEKTINVYSSDGELMSTYTGKVAIETYNNYIKFSIDGKNYVYYNCCIEIVEDS